MYNITRDTFAEIKARGVEGMEASTDAWNTQIYNAVMFHSMLSDFEFGPNAVNVIQSVSEAPLPKIIPSNPLAHNFRYIFGKSSIM